MAKSDDNSAAAAASDLLKEEGNVLFQTGNYTAAFDKYDEAFHRLSSSSSSNDDDKPLAADMAYRRAVLRSNRSNCLFESGRYGASIDDARQCLALLEKIPALSSEENGGPSEAQVENLQRKNLLRIARAGIYGGDILSSDAEAKAEEACGDSSMTTAYETNVVGPLRILVSCGDAAYEKRAARMLDQANIRRTLLLNEARGEEEEEKKDDDDDTNKKGRMAPLKLPSIHRASLYGSSVCEYYNYGHDAVSSALGPGYPAEEGSDEPSCPAMELGALPEDHLSTVSVLFGGVGDARHVYTTLCDAHKQWTGLGSQVKKDAFRLHLALNDVNPTFLARDALVLAALARLGSCAPDVKDCDDRQSEAFRLATLVEYTFFGYTMPPSVHDCLISFIDELVEEDFASLKSWMIADDDVWSRIEDVMVYWRSAEEGTGTFPTTTKVVDIIYNSELKPDAIYSELPEASGRVREMREAASEENRKRKEDLIKQLDGMTLDEFPPDLVGMVRAQLAPEECTDERVLEFCRSFYRENMEEMDADEIADAENGTTSEGRFLDEIFIKDVNAILPPKGCAGALYDGIWDTQYSPDTCKAMIKEAKRDVKLHWRVNRTMFDPAWTEFRGGDLETNEFNPVADIGSSFLFASERVLPTFVNEPTGSEVNDMDFFQCSTLFFWNTAHALSSLLVTGAVRFELSIGPVTHFCRAIQNNPSRRCPKRFHRIFLSNVPDYIGMLSVFTEIAPLLHRPSKLVPTFAQSNILLHTGIWQDYSHYIYSATGIPTPDDMLKLLGIRHLTYDSVWAPQNQWTWSESDQRPQASRDELTGWLHRVFLTSLLPPERDPFGRCNEQCTTNVASFMRLCTFCVETLRYPPHWIGSVLDDIVAACSTGLLKTKATIPTSSPMQYIANDKPQRIDIRAFQVDIKTQIKLWSRHYCRTLAPMAALSALKDSQFNKYRLILGEDDTYLTINGGMCIGAGGFQYTMCLGFVLSKDKHPDGFDATELSRAAGFFPRSSSDGNGKIRSTAITKGGKDLHIFSCMAFNCDPAEQRHSIEFYLCKDDFDEYSDFYIHPFRTDSWNQIGYHISSDLMRLRDAVQVDD